MVVMVTHECALNECTTQADKWTMCDEHAKSMGIYIPADKETALAARKPANQKYYSRRTTHLPDDVWRKIKHAVSTFPISTVMESTGVTRVPLTLIRDNDKAVPLSAHAANRLIAWAEGGASVHPRPKPDRSAAQKRSLEKVEQHHIDAVRLAVQQRGSFYGAERAIGLSEKTLITMVKERKPGDLARPGTLRKIDEWSVKNSLKDESVGDMYYRSGPLSRASWEALVKVCQDNGMWWVSRAVKCGETTISRMVRDPSASVSPKTRVKIDRWVSDGCPMPARSVNAWQGRGFREVEQWHVDIAHYAVELFGTVHAAAKGVGMTDSRFRTFVGKSAGDTAPRPTLDCLEEWSKVPCRSVA